MTTNYYEVITAPQPWLNTVVQQATHPHLWGLLDGEGVIDITNNATLVNLHLSNAAKHLDTMFATSTPKRREET